MVDLDEVDRTRSDRAVTFRPGSAKRLPSHGLRPDSRWGQAYLMLARSYGSSLGRFTGPDPGSDTSFINPQSWNHYAYVANNPLMFIDPSGTAAWSLEASIGSQGIGRTVGDSSVGAEKGKDGACNIVNERRALAALFAKADGKTGPIDPTDPTRPLFKNKVVRDALLHAWVKTVNGSSRNGKAEAGFSIQYKDNHISIANRIDSVNGTGPANELFIQTDIDTIAIAHVHGNNSVQMPSEWDLTQKEKQIDYPDYVLTRTGLFVTVPCEHRYIGLTPSPIE